MMLAILAALAPVAVTVTSSTPDGDRPGWAPLAEEGNGRPAGWCAPAGATLTLTFDRAISFTTVSLLTTYGKEIPDKLQITTDKGTVDSAIPAGQDFLDLAVDPAPTRKLVLKIITVRDAAVRACVRGLSVSSKSKVPLLVGVTPQQAAALPAFLRAANTALESCDAKAIAGSFAFPIKVTAYYPDPQDPNEMPKDPIVATYASAAKLAEACGKDGSILALGYSSEYQANSLEDDLGELKSTGLGTARLGRRWVLNSKDGWRVTEIESSEPASEVALEKSPLDEWFAAYLLGTDHFVAGAKAIVFRPPTSIHEARSAFGAIAVSPDDKIGKLAVNAQSMSRDGEARWMTVVTKFGKREIRGTALAVKGDDGWQMAVVMLSAARANDAVNKEAQAGKSPAFAPLPPLTGDKDLLAAVAALAAGPIDKVAEGRKDLVALGSGPGEKTVGGGKLAGPWKAAWANKVTFGGGFVTMSPTGRTAFVAVDATLDKGKYKVPFRLGLVFDKAGSGAWSLAHVHFATP